MTQLSFQINVDTELDESTWQQVLKELFPQANIKPIKDKAIFDWDVEVVTKQFSDDEYWQLADELYNKLIQDSKKFSDWEYKFLSDTYSRAIEKTNYSQKQREWIDKLRSKYL